MWQHGVDDRPDPERARALMWTLALLFLGLVGLWAGTELALRSTIELARRLGVSEHFLGLTVLAVGTDLPELVVAIQGGIQQLDGIDASGIVIGNAIGSAITQGSVVLGLAGMCGYLRLAPRFVRRDGVILVLLAGLLALLAADGRVERYEAGGLLVVYAIYWIALAQAEDLGTKIRRPQEGRWFATGAKIVVGVTIVILSAELVVDGAVSVAESWGVNQTVIGVVLIGVGTSLPELALSIAAAMKGRAGLSVGNIIGSNIFDLLVPIGVSGLIHPIAVETGTLALDLPFLAVVTILGLTFFLWKRGLQRWEASILVVLYVAFAVVRIGLN